MVPYERPSGEKVMINVESRVGYYFIQEGDGINEAMRNADIVAKRLSSKYDKAWAIAVIFLFVLVGASVAIDSAKDAGINAIDLTYRRFLGKE